MSARGVNSGCMEVGCSRPHLAGKRRCDWHWMAQQPLAWQEQAAQKRQARGTAKVPRASWPSGTRWCSGCSSLVPLWYCSGSRCRACERRSRRSRHVEATYGISGDEERALRRWQGEKCFICGRRAVTRQLATDHDHETGEVRGMLCSDDKFGCNVLLRRILGDPGAAARLMAYVAKTPLQRMREGEPPWSWVSHPADQGDSPEIPF